MTFEEKVEQLVKQNAPRNTEWTLTVSAPLLRPGLVIKAGPVSENYIVETAKKAMDVIRGINR